MSVSPSIYRFFYFTKKYLKPTLHYRIVFKNLLETFIKFSKIGWWVNFQVFCMYVVFNPITSNLNALEDGSPTRVKEAHKKIVRRKEYFWEKMFNCCFASFNHIFCRKKWKIFFFVATLNPCKYTNLFVMMKTLM